MNIAIIPWNDTFLQDKIFGEVDPSINYDDRLTSFSRMKKEFERHGDKLCTVDMFDPLKVDFFLFFQLFFLFQMFQIVEKTGRLEFRI